MKSEILALEIELNTSSIQKEEFRFNETMLIAVQAGLSVIYDEVFIWSCGDHLAVWVVGEDAELLLRTFAHHESHYKKIQQLDQHDAIALLENITNGKSWTECDVQTKIASMEFGYNISEKPVCMNAKLLPFITKGMHILQTLYRNEKGRNEGVMQMDFSPLDSEDVVVIANNVFPKFSVN